MSSLIQEAQAAYVLGVRLSVFEMVLLFIFEREWLKSQQRDTRSLDAPTTLMPV